MRDLYRLMPLPLVAVACNAALGLDPGRPWPEDSSGAGGEAGPNGQGGSALASVGGRGAATSGGSSGTIGNPGGVAGNAARGGTDDGGMGGSGGTADPGGAGAGGMPPCSSIECRKQGFDLCMNGGCADITSEDCSIVLGSEWIDDDPEAEPFVIGACGRFDPATIETLPFYWTLKLAMKEFTEYGPIPIGGVERRPVLLLCHAPPDSDVTPVFRGFNHLVGTVGVSAILNFLASRLELHEAVRLGLALKDVFVVDYGGANSRLLRLEDGGRLWHMLGDTALVSFPFVPLVQRVEEHLNPGASTGQAARPTRLALLRNDRGEEYELLIAASLASSLRINGAPVNAQPDAFFYVTWDPRVPLIDRARMVADFEPDIVVDFGGESDMAAMIDTAMRDSALPPPFYVFPPTQTGSRALLDNIAMDSSLRTRMVGMNHAAAEDTTLYDAYLGRVELLAADELDAQRWESLYDATYFLLYSAVAGGPTGTRMSEGMARLVTGRQRDIGPENIASVIDALADPQGTLSFHGTLGKPDFHWTGSRIAYANAWCVSEDLDFMTDVLRYDPDTGELTGTFPCFPF
jgi:hypothetical protein